MNAPLGNDSNGLPLELPDTAACWRVRRSAARGPGAVVYDPDDGGPLLLPIEATGEDLRDAGCGPGRYRLEACDSDGQPLGLVGFAEIGRGEGDATDVASPIEATRSIEDSNGLLREAIAAMRLSNEKLTETIGAVARAMATAFGPVNPAPPTVEQVALERPQEAAATPTKPDYMPVLVGLAQQVLPLVAQFLAAKAAAAAAPPSTPPAPQPSTTGATS